MPLKILPILFVFWSTLAIGQRDTLTDAQLKYIYKRILKTDQSHVKDNEIRQLIFELNFNQIIDIIKVQGYPKFKVQPNRKKDRGIIRRATMITFFHILQSEPELLLDPKIIELLKNEIEIGNMPKDLLLGTLKKWKKFNDIPENNGAQDLSADILKLYHQAIKKLEDL